MDYISTGGGGGGGGKRGGGGGGGGLVKRGVGAGAGDYHVYLFFKRMLF